MNLQTLKNTLVFMERVTVTGKECVAWVEAVIAIQADIRTLEAPPSVIDPRPPGVGNAS
jgi:hypothetical protein